MSDTKKKSDLNGLLKKHPKEIALGAAGVVVVVLALRKKAAGGMSPTVADPSAATGGGSVSDTSAADAVQGNLDNAISSLNSRLDSITALTAQPVGVVSSTPPADVTTQLTAPVVQGVLIPTTVTPPAPQVQILPYVGVPAPTPVPTPVATPTPVPTPFSTERDWVRVPTPPAPVTLIRPTVSTQGLLGKTTAPRSARGD